MKEKPNQPLPKHYTTMPDGTIVDQTEVYEHIEELIRQGKARRLGNGELPEDFFTRPLPKAKASVLEALLEDRRNGR